MSGIQAGGRWVAPERVRDDAFGHVDIGRSADPPIYNETHAALIKRYKRKGYVCPELTSWFVLAALDELSDGDRAAIALRAVNSVSHGFMAGEAA